MAHLDEYMQDAEEHNLGKDTADKAKSTVKKETSKGLKKAGKKGLDKLMDVTGAGEVKKAAAEGIKKGAKAVANAGKKAMATAAKFLFTNPVGWVVTAGLVIGGIAIMDKMEEKADEQAVAAMSSEVVEAEEDGGGISEEISDDGIAILMGDCPEEKEQKVGEIATDASMEANAQKLYSVFKGYGLNDACIAGILGNFQVECSIDSTTVEGIYDEPHQIGPKKQAAFADLSSYTSGTVFSLYASSGISINQNAYKASDGKYYCGIGMGQWTGPAAYQLISVASGTGHDWYSIEYQLAYLVCDTQYRPGFFATWKESMSTSPEEAAAYFAKNWEGNTTMAQAERKSNAAAWLSKISSWSVDESFYQSIISLSQNMGGAAADMAKGEAKDDCPEDVGSYDNASIASAAVSYAYPTKAEGNGNNGTALYQQVHNNIFPGDPWYMSCDRSVACAVRWSGSDDEFPPGNTDAQYAYMKASPKWTSVGLADSVSADKLEPGDIFVLNGHIFMYTGSEIIQKIHGSKADASSDSVSGSFEERSPGCGNDTTSILSRGGQDWIGRGLYEVFRCTQPDHSETYKNAGSSAVLD